MSNVIDREELKKLLDSGEKFFLVDVLPEEHFNEEHIKGAINVPYDSLVQKARELFKKDDKIVLYCGSPTCNASMLAAKKLEALGYTNVSKYEGGLTSWKEAGYETE